MRADSVASLGSNKLREHWAIALVVVAAGIIYLPTVGASLHGDDYFAFIDISTKPFPKFMTDVVLFKDSNVAWRPLTQAYYYGWYQVFGLYGPAYHAVNFTVFELTLVALYMLALAWGLGRLTAAGAAGIVGIFPSHVNTVIWVTNGGRMLAVCLFLIGLLALLKGTSVRRWRWEAVAWFLFVLGFLCDESLVSLALVATLAAPVFDSQPGRIRRGLIRTPALLAPALAVGLSQLLLAPRGSTGQIDFSAASIPQHVWGLAARMTDPTGPVLMRDLSETQWVLGALTITGLAMVLVAASGRARVLAAWAFAALAPFALTLPITPGRYVYPALVPFSMLLAWSAASLLGATRKLMPPAVERPFHRLSGPRLLEVAGACIYTAMLLAAALTFGPITREKNAAFAADAEKYHRLAVELKQSLPTVEPGTTLVIYYGVWNEPYGFVSAVARTVYRDRTINVVNIPRGQVEQGRRVYAKERRLFNTERGLIVAPQDVLQAR